MNKQLLDFFREISKYPNRHRNYEDLAGKEKVSSRTIRNYAATLLDDMVKLGVGDILQQSERGLVYTGTPEQTDAILKEISGGGFYDYHLSPDERLFSILLLLLGGEEPLTISQLSEQLYVSRNTILNDIERARSFFRQKGSAFDERLNRGYRLEADEQTRRETIFELCAPYMSTWHAQSGQPDIFGYQVDSVFSVDELFPPLEQIVKRVESAFFLSVSDKVYQQTLFSLAILTRRFLEGSFLPGRMDGPSMAGSSAGQIARRFLMEIEKVFGVNCPAWEADYLSVRLCSCHFDVPENCENTKDIYLHVILRQFLLALEGELGCDLVGDAQLFVMLTQHIKSMEPSGGSDALVNLAMGDLIQSYPRRYEAVKKHIGPLEEYVGHPLAEEELVLILMHILAATERGTTDNARPRVIVVCHVGAGTGYFLADRLREIFNLEIVAVTAMHRLPALLEKESCDLVVSTVNLAVEVACRWLKVSPSLEDAEMVQLQRILGELRKEKRDMATLKRGSRHAASISEAGQLAPDYILLDVECADWQSAIRTAAAPLVACGAIRLEYVEAIFQSVAQNGPYFVFTPGVAIAHAAPANGVNRLCCSFLRLRHPVAFGHKGNDPVRFVIVIGITNVESQIGLISSLMNVMYDPQSLPLLVEADESEIRDIFKK